MSFDTFKAEAATIKNGEAILADGKDTDFKGEFKSLVGSYKKLLKDSRRLVRMSDRSEERLKQAHQRIVEQQQELERAHQKLSQHAEILEERVRERTKELVASQAKLERLVALGIALSSERQHQRFIEMILDGAKELTNADGGIVFVRDDDDRMVQQLLRVDSLELRQGGIGGGDIEYEPVSMRDADGRPNYFNLVSHVALTRRTVAVANAYESKDFEFGEIRDFDAQNDYHTGSLLAVPLRPRQGEVIGVLLLLNARAESSGRVLAFTDEMSEFVQALTSQAAVAMDNQNLIEAQEKLFDSIIRLLASAIDTKSPYTGGHCERVPQLGMSLARAACEDFEGPFAEFDMNEDDWREFRIAAWLHDCGKVTTPEYVVDKATKLETIYNRIHEIRTRFEVKLRDYIIDYKDALLAGAGEPEALRADLDAKIAELRDSFEFIAESNIGSERMAGERVERMSEIAEITWERHFDDRLGLSEDELRRLAKAPPSELPVEEKLIVDKREHIIARPRGTGTFDPKYGFKVKVPKNLYNLGELYNLSIERGTLTDEERFKINEHIIQTIIMLEELPFPKNMSRVAEFAGGHHESMIGTGYPRGLKRDEMSLQARILAIADIFEALTASDRPYKKAKTLDVSLRIMSGMRDRQHIDPDLFSLFLRSGVFRDYAEQFMDEEQIDEVDIANYLEAPAVAAE